MSPAREARRDLLFDLLVGRPDGVTIWEIAEALGETKRDPADKAVRDLRLFLGDFDSVNLVAESQGEREPWLYRLVGNYDDARVWVANRIVDTHGRLRTIHAVLASCVSATDGRSIEGKKSRIMEMAIRHLLESLESVGTE